MIRFSGDFEALVTTTFDAVFLFVTSNHVLSNMMPLLGYQGMQTLITIALTSFTVSGSDK